MAITTTPLGFQKPDGLDPVRNGDNVIAANGAKAEELHQDARGRLTVIEAKNVSQDADIVAARTNAVADAKTYADTQNQAYRVVDWAQFRAEDDEHSTADRAYADTKDAANRTAWAAADTAKLAEAKTYTDGQVATDRGRLTTIEGVNTAQDGRLTSLEVFKPSTTPDDPTYAHETLSVSGQLIEGEMWDGTKHIPHLKTDRLETPSGVEAPGAYDGYTRVIVSATNQLIMGEREDGTVHIPNLETGALVVETPPVPALWKIVIVAGQSNSIWRFNTDGPALAEPDPRLKWWNRTNSTMVDVSPNVTPSIASAFSRKYLEENPDVNILIVPVTAGTTGFRTSSISPAPEGYLYSANGTWDRNLTADVNNLALRLFASLAGARTATNNAEVLAMLWSQGENDRTRMTEATYAPALDDLIGQIRTQVNQPGMPVVIGSMTPEEIANPQAVGTEGILRALENTQARLTNTAYVWGPANMLQYQEQIHWSPEGNQTRGEIMALDGLRRARLNVTGGLPYPPRNVTIKRSGGTAYVGWDYPRGRAVSFTLETSTDNGATWQAATLDGPLVTAATLTVSATLPLWVRLKTTNETGTSYPTMEAKA